MTDAPPWQPIETAPRDGTRILGYFPDYRAEGSVWNTWWQGAKQDGCDFWWYEKSVSHFPPQPSHWMPLPDPPEQARNETD